MDKNGRYVEDIDSGLNNCLNLEANKDQTGRAFIQDVVLSMLDEGCVALVPVETTIDPKSSNSYQIDSMRTGKITEWYPDMIRVRLYNDRTGEKEEILLPKNQVAIIENPLYAVVNEYNSTMQRLIRKLSLLDVTDEQTASGKLDLIIQLPYVIKTEARREQVERRRKDIINQLAGSQYGIAYTDGTEKITQLNRSLENNLLKQVEYLTNMVYSQLGITQSVLDGTADEKTMLNYMNRTVEPIISAIVDELKRKFLTKTARSQLQSIVYFRDPFRLVPVNDIAEIADKLTRNEIMTSNEIRQIVGMQPSKDPNASSGPATPKQIKTLKALSDTGVLVTWVKVSGCTKYEVQYATNRSYFDSNPDQVHSRTVENVTHTEITGIETGHQYFFRLRAYNSNDQVSGWSAIKSLKLGKPPGAPTTWSSTTTATVGESVRLYWVHNSEDNSSQTYAQLETTINGTTKTETIKNTKTGDNIDDTSYKSLSTTAYTEGTTILWRVRTAGVTGKYGAWSVQRTINVYAVPTVQLNVTDSTGSEVTTLESFPFYIKAETAPNTQSVLSYHVSITSTQAYSTSDRTGTETVISRGQEVYSLFTDGPQNLLVELNAGNIDLENNITYKVTCTASFDSGLTASAESEFNVGWTEQTYGINAEIGYDSDTYSCSIRAYCADKENKLIPGVTLAIYRRDYTGELIEIANGLVNSSYTYVTDPHPALDYSRYRIVATEVSTGAVSYYDVPPYPIKETSIIIQWEETWDNLVTEGLNERDIVMEPLWSGSLVKLPYNIDVSDKNGVDVSLVEYIGRKRPVSYYGTQLGETSSWKTEIPRWDIDTLYALRRLAVYTGDVYIREPSGTGYWANVAVSISQTHCEVKIPISFDITRVEGGI